MLFTKYMTVVSELLISNSVLKSPRREKNSLWQDDIISISIDY